MNPTLLAYLMLDATRKKYDWLINDTCPDEERLENLLSAMDKLWWKLSSEEAEAFNALTIMELEE